MLKQEIIESVLKPGNLVWGVRINETNWGSIAREGIKPASIVENNPGSQKEICTGILPRGDIPRNRYHETLHHGPKGESPYTHFQAAIILSRERLLREFPSQVKAVGSIFSIYASAVYSRRENPYYDFDLSNRTVFGIPIDQREPSYPDEVRICPGLKEVVLDPYLWEGIVVRRWHCYWLYLDTKDSGQRLNLPVIDTEADLLTTHLP